LAQAGVATGKLMNAVQAMATFQMLGKGEHFPSEMQEKYLRSEARAVYSGQPAIARCPID
jgi:hypothetical protein